MISESCVTDGHFVQFYDSDSNLAESVSEYVLSGLAIGEAIIVVATHSHVDSIEINLKNKGIDVALVRQSRQLQILDCSDLLAEFMVDCSPDPLKFEIVINRLIKEIPPKCSGIRVFGEMVAQLWAEQNNEAALKLEYLWNHARTKHTFNLLCAYPIVGFKDADSCEDFAKICGAHSHILPTDHVNCNDEGPELHQHAVVSLQQKTLALETEIAERKRVEQDLRDQTQRLGILQNVMGKLAGRQELQEVVQCVTDAGREISGAAFGAFFYNLGMATAESYTLFALSGVSHESFENFPMPRKTAVFSPTFDGEGSIRSADITLDPRYGHLAPYFGMPVGHLPVKSYLASPVNTKTGEVLGGLFFGHPEPGVFTDISEQMICTLSTQAAIAIENVQLRAALQIELEAAKLGERSSRMLAAIVESSGDAIISKDFNGIITSWNEGAEKMFGYKSDEVIGQPVTILIPEDHIDEEPSILDQVRSGVRINHYETIRQRKNGERIEVSLTVSPITFNGKIVGASKIVRDISSQKQHEKALQEANEAVEHARQELESKVLERTASLQEAVAQMEEFSYTVSHDLRAPLRAMNMYSNLLLEELGVGFEEESLTKHCLSRIADNASRMDRMILDILTYGRVARDGVSLERISLNNFVSQLMQNYPEMQPPHAVIQVETLSDVIGHEPSLAQAVTNLLGNAVKFVPKGVTPRVRVWTENDAGEVCLWIEDNGIGVDPNYQHRLFGMFERIHPNLPYEGAGVGLAIVRKAVERMNGRVGMESDGKTGSRFWIRLPRGDNIQ